MEQINDQLYSVDQIRQLEELAVKQYNISESQLMASAGLTAFNALQAHFPHAKSVVVIAGHGNNGGDGYVVARHAAQAGMTVRAYHIGSLDDLSQVAQASAADAQKAGVEFEPYVESINVQCDVVVDALLGIGLHGEVRGVYLDAINTINHCEAKVLSIDIPSGLEANTGAVLGASVRADLTVTFIGIKRGLLTGNAPGFIGELICDDLQIPQDAFKQIKANTVLLHPETLPARRRDAHKGAYGHVLVIGGDSGMSGAVQMAAEAALRIGAGLVSVATRQEHAIALNNNRPELMCHGVKKASDLTPLFERATVIVVGPGLGKQSFGKEMLEAVLQQDLPKVIDADALNLLAENPRQTANAVLTPHPGEAARLLEFDGGEQVQRNRFEAINRLQKSYDGVCVLKGAGTLIKADDDLVHLCRYGNPGMASGGMGDVLSGVIGGLIAQQLSLLEAAIKGVYIHAAAADKAADEGGERGLLAMDVVKELRFILNGLSK